MAVEPGQVRLHGPHTLARYRLRTLQLQAAYTWSHSIDNQSDPLTRRFFNLNFTTITSGVGDTVRRRHSRSSSTATAIGAIPISTSGTICFCSACGSRTAPPIGRAGWQVSWMAAFRTGISLHGAGGTEAPEFGRGL